MTKCIKLICTIQPSKNFLDRVRAGAIKFDLEGVGKPIGIDTFSIILHGTKEHIDLFLDALYKYGAAQKVFELEVEPHLKDQDYRGIFRIVA